MLYIMTHTVHAILRLYGVQYRMKIMLYITTHTVHAILRLYGLIYTRKIMLYTTHSVRIILRLYYCSGHPVR